MSESIAARKDRVAKELRRAVDKGWAYMYPAPDGAVYNLFQEAAMLLESDRPRAAPEHG